GLSQPASSVRVIPPATSIGSRRRETVGAPSPGSEIGERVQCFIVQKQGNGDDDDEREQRDRTEQNGESAVALLRTPHRARSRGQRSARRGGGASLGVGSRRRRRSPLRPEVTRQRQQYRSRKNSSARGGLPLAHLAACASFRGRLRNGPLRSLVPRRLGAADQLSARIG